jgi:hypothetical protein
MSILDVKDPTNVIHHDHKTIQDQSFVSSVIGMAVDNGLAIPFFFKHALPLDNGVCAEIDGSGFGINAIIFHRGGFYLFC